MFGSNVFSSMQSELVNVRPVTLSYEKDQLNTVQQTYGLAMSKEQREFTLSAVPLMSAKKTIEVSNPFSEESEEKGQLTKLSGVNNRSKQRLERLK